MMKKAAISCQMAAKENKKTATVQGKRGETRSTCKGNRQSGYAP